MAKAAKKRGRKPGVKVGPYKKTAKTGLSLRDQIKDISSRLAKLEKVLG